jgi:hypothetical protein
MRPTVLTLFRIRSPCGGAKTGIACMRREAVSPRKRDRCRFRPAQGNRANKAKRETAMGTQAVEPADEVMHDGRCGGQSAKQVFNTEATEKIKPQRSQKE